jgi:hypothetical protein
MHFSSGERAFRLCETVCVRIGPDVVLTFCNAKAHEIVCPGPHRVWQIGAEGAPCSECERRREGRTLNTRFRASTRAFLLILRETDLAGY